MSNMIIVKPLTPSAVTASGFSGATNLLTPDPKEVAVLSGTGGQFIDIDLGATTSIDSFFLGFHTYPAGGWVDTISGGAGSYTTTSFFSGTVGNIRATSDVSSPPRRHFFTRLPAPVSARYVRIAVNSLDGLSGYSIGVLAVGLAFQPTYNREWGSGRSIIDTGVREPLLSGGFGIGEGVRKAGYRWTLGDLSDAEVATLYDLALDRGETRATLFVEDPDATTGLNERIHYGLFERFEPYERMNPSQTRWALSMQEWV
jgi:hypothetical protein